MKFEIGSGILHLVAPALHEERDGVALLETCGHEVVGDLVAVGFHLFEKSTSV